MARRQSPVVEVPKPESERPLWSRIGIISFAGFAVGLAWPKLAGVALGPNVPESARTEMAAAAASASAKAEAAPSATASAVAAAPAPEKTPSNQQLVVVGPGTITKCADKKNRKVEKCGTLQFDPLALPKLRELSKCPSALGLEGELSIGFEIDFEKKQVGVVKGKKTSLPTSTVQGILQCAGREFSNVSLEDVPHEHRRYTVFYTATFYPPGKHPEAAQDAPAQPADGEAAGSTSSESEASGAATVSWDTALVRKTPKDGEVTARLVRGTRVKILARQNDWYRIEAGTKTGWIYRGAIGL